MQVTFEGGASEVCAVATEQQNAMMCEVQSAAADAGSTADRFAHQERAGAGFRQIIDLLP